MLESSPQTLHLKLKDNFFFSSPNQPFRIKEFLYQLKTKLLYHQHTSLTTNHLLFFVFFLVFHFTHTANTPTRPQATSHSHKYFFLLFFLLDSRTLSHDKYLISHSLHARLKPIFFFKKNKK